MSTMPNGGSSHVTDVVKSNTNTRHCTLYQHSPKGQQCMCSGSAVCSGRVGWRVCRCVVRVCGGGGLHVVWDACNSAEYHGTTQWITDNITLIASQHGLRHKATHVNIIIILLLYYVSSSIDCR